MTGASLKAFRESRKLNQTQFAARVGIGRRTLINYENDADRAVPLVLALACRAFGDSLPPIGPEDYEETAPKASDAA